MTFSLHIECWTLNFMKCTIAESLAICVISACDLTQITA